MTPMMYDNLDANSDTQELKLQLKLLKYSEFKVAMKSFDPYEV